MPEKKVGIISQARMTSTRLPGKVLLRANGKSVLQHHIERLKSAGCPVIVATTTNKTDDVIVDLCDSLGVPYYRGSEDNVLSRYFECAEKYQLDTIVRVTSDCPLIDGHLIKDAIQKFHYSPQNTYLSNCIKRTYPRGFDFEIFSFSSLSKAFREASTVSELEHVTPFIRSPEKNEGVYLEHVTRSQGAEKFRITLDEPDDWKLISTLFEVYGAESLEAEEIIHVLETNPSIASINMHVEQKKV